MYSFGDLQREIGAKIEWLKDNNGPVLHPDWITQAILADHQEIDGKDADFHLCCSRMSVRKEVREQLNKFKPEASPSERQLVLDGFEHLQQYYVVTRDKEQVAVRVDALTDSELDQKANELDGMGRACLNHADEIRRYKDLRRASLKAAHIDQVALGFEARC